MLSIETEVDVKDLLGSKVILPEYEDETISEIKF